MSGLHLILNMSYSTVPVAEAFPVPSDHPERIPAMIFVNGAGNLLKNYELVPNVKDGLMAVFLNDVGFANRRNYLKLIQCRCED